MAINVLRGFAQQAVTAGINKAANDFRSGLLSAGNSNLPKGLSSSAILRPPIDKLSTKNYRFPIDVEGPPGTGNQGHYIMFFINKQQGAKIRMGKADAAFEGRKNLKKERANNGGKDVQLGNPADSGAESIEEYEAMVQAEKNRQLSTTMLERPPTIRMETGIALYMPPSVTVTYGAEYQDTEIGSGASIISNAYNQIKSGESTSSAVISGIKEFGAEAKDEAIAKLLGVAGMVPGLENAMSVIEMNRGFIKSPRLELMFKGIPKREFSYEFKMIPKSAEEADQIKSIVKEFKTNMLPEMKGTNARRQTIPSTFDIQYMYDGGEAYDKGGNLHKISTCVLESMNVTYGGDRYKTYEGGVPVETSLTLNFKEMDLITAELADQGF